MNLIGTGKAMSRKLGRRGMNNMGVTEMLLHGVIVVNDLALCRMVRESQFAIVHAASLTWSEQL